MPDGVFTPEGVAFLQTPEGRRLLDEAGRFPDLVEAVTALRKTWPREQVAMAVETAALRLRAASKIQYAAEMFFTREAMEQASDSRIAAYRAARFSGFARVEDWGCGVGVDALALAEVTDVTGWDTDPLRIAMARANAGALARSRAVFRTGDYLARPPDADAMWADPGRRPGGRRVTDPAFYEPSLAAIARHAADRPLGVKVSPAIEARHIPADVEAEFISVGGELKEAALWYGGLRTADRRATVLPAGETLVPTDAEAPVAAPGAVLYDPDPAILRAGALSDLALRLNAWRVDERVGYLSGAEPVATPFAQTLMVEAVMPWNLKAVKRHLRTNRLRVEEVRKRGLAGDVDAIRKSLTTDGDIPVVLILTRCMDRPTAILARRAAP